MTLFLTIPHTSDTCLGGTELELTWKPLAQRVTLIELEDAMKSAKGEE